jgi:hypothetical protein
LTNIRSDLDKLVYTMKTLHTIEPTQYPAFWNEEWLRWAIDELDTRKMTPEERAYFARVTAANAEVVNAEKKRIEEAEERRENLVKSETVKNLLGLGVLTTSQIAQTVGVSEELVRKLSGDR